MTHSSPGSERDFLEQNIQTLAFHLGRDGARLNISHDIGGLAVDPGDVLKEASRRLSAVAQTSSEPVAWRWRTMGCSQWVYRDKDDFPDGAGELQPLYATPPQPAPADASIFAECAEIALEHVGAFNTKWTEESRHAYNVACRDIAEAIQTRASNRKVMDALAPAPSQTARDCETLARQLLAEEYERGGNEGHYPSYAKHAIEGKGAFTLCSIRAIMRALSLSRPLRCEGCDQNYADPPSKLCPGCQAYQEHQR